MTILSVSHQGASDLFAVFLLSKSPLPTTYDFRSTACPLAYRCAGLRYPVHAVHAEVNSVFKYLLLFFVLVVTGRSVWRPNDTFAMIPKYIIWSRDRSAKRLYERRTVCRRQPKPVHLFYILLPERGSNGEAHSAINVPIIDLVQSIFMSIAQETRHFKFSTLSIITLGNNLTFSEIMVCSVKT